MSKASHDKKEPVGELKKDLFTNSLLGATM